MTSCGLLGTALACLGSWLWITSASQGQASILLLIGAALFFWVAGPWELQQASRRPSVFLLALGATSLSIGWASGFFVLLAAGWTLLASQWIFIFFTKPKANSNPSLFALLILSFPWISNDLHALSWWFRITGTEVSELLLALAGCEVLRSGTQLMVDGMVISVENACSGMQMLQLMVLGGIAMSLLQTPERNNLWWYVPVLIAAAWTANTMRIIMTCALAIIISPEAARGTAHQWAGTISLLLMFSLCAIILSISSRK